MQLTFHSEQQSQSGVKLKCILLGMKGLENKIIPWLIQDFIFILKKISKTCIEFVFWKDATT